jgi:hypothetical protein
MDSSKFTYIQSPLGTYLQLNTYSKEYNWPKMKFCTYNMHVHVNRSERRGSWLNRDVSYGYKLSDFSLGEKTTLMS